MKHPSGNAGGALGFYADLDGLLPTSRNLSALSAHFSTLAPRALGTLARRLPVQARRDIQAEYAIAAGRVNRDLSARVTAEGVRLTGHFRGIGLMQFNARKAPGGVRATVLRGKPNLRENAFIAVGINRNVQVFRREGAKRVMQQGRYAGKRRQPLVAEYGASVAQMLAKGRRPQRLIDFARGVLATEIDRLLRVSSSHSPTSHD